MLPIGSMIKLALIATIVVVVAGGLWYVTGLRADLAVSQENARQMTEAVAQQQAVIENIRQEQAKIQEINKDLADTVKSQNKDLNGLRDRFSTAANGDKRDIGSIAVIKPDRIERAINIGTVNALRCVEIATGSPLTEKEKNAKLPNEINKECPALANPNYKPVAVD